LRRACACDISWFVTTGSLPPDDIRAAAATYHELGPEYQQAVVENFLNRISREIDARVDSRMGRTQPAPPQPAARHSLGLALPVTSMAFGIPLTAIGLNASGGGSAAVVVWIWVVIGVINVAYAWRSRPQQPPGR